MEQNLKTCSHCGQKVDVVYNFCPKCGTRFVVHNPKTPLDSEQEPQELTPKEAKRIRKQSERYDVD